MVKGEKISQLAAYTATTGKWHPLDLKTPVQGAAVPIVGMTLAAYAADNRVFAFSAKSGKWDSVELEDGAKPVPVVGLTNVKFEHKDHLYVFNANTGKWTDYNAESDAVVTPSGRVIKLPKE